MAIKVGYISNCYPEKRNIINKVSGVKYINCKYRNYFAYKRTFSKTIDNLLGRYNKLQYKSFNDMYSFKGSDFNIDLFHYFNHVNLGRGKWITTFETFLPRYKEFIQISKRKKEDFILNDAVKRALEAMSDDKCKKLIAISENCKMVEDIGLDYYAEYKEVIMKKIEVLHPPQDSLISNFENKISNKDKNLKLIFIGNHFYRKGGYELVFAFNNVCKKFKEIPLELIVIGDLEKYTKYYDHTKDNTSNEYEEIKKIILSNNKITHFTNLPYNKVIELIKSANIGLLPTWSDTYGYSVLEFQAAGCPVISTDVRSLTEINNNDMGWLIKLPQDKFKEPICINKESKDSIRYILINELERIFEEIMQNPNIIEKKGKMAYENIYKNHNVEIYEQKLKKIYIDSLK